MYAIIKCVRLHISEMCGKLQFLKNQIDFIPLIFLGNSHILIAQVLHHHSLENCAFILWLRNKKYATSLIKSDNNWRSGDDCPARNGVTRSWADGELKWLSSFSELVFYGLFITLSEMQIPRMPDTPVFQHKHKNKIESQPQLSLLPVTLIGPVPSPLLLTPTNLGNQKLSLFNGENTYIKRVNIWGFRV